MAGGREEMVAEVNRIYWETDMPVTEMAERLGISRRTIYDMLVPTSAGETCPVCGGELVYPNRSARLAGEAICSNCGRTQDITLLHELATVAPGEPAEAGAEHLPVAGAPPAKRPRDEISIVPSSMPRRPSPALAALLVAGIIVTLAVALLTPSRGRRRWWR